MAHRQFIGVPYLQLLVSRAGGKDTSVVRIPLDHADRTSSPIIIAPAEHTHTQYTHTRHTHTEQSDIGRKRKQTKEST